MRNGIVKTMGKSLLLLLIVGLLAFIVYLNIFEGQTSGEAKTIDDIIENSYQTSEITTDLNDGSFVRIQFQIITDNKKAREEVEKREFQLKNILIKELGKMKEDAFKSGLTELEKVVKEKLNVVMEEGKITEVYTINKILQ